MRVFRFEKNEARRLETIKRNEIYISSPDNFNDLDDCRIRGIFTPDFDTQFHGKLMECINILYPKSEANYFPLPQKILDGLKDIVGNITFSSSSLDDKIRREINQNSHFYKIREYLRKNTGVCCFFKDMPNHPLMWAHYAHSHTGFCVEYEIDNIEAPFYEVNYSSHLPYPSINELLLCPEESFLGILTTKTLEWNYEKEVRYVKLNALLDGENGKAIPLPSPINPVRLITGQKFNHSENKDLIDSLGLEVVPYKAM